ncbi:MAG: discoidin domain-containing protein [Spirochaetales bacterium]|nr:discoidin domain-containing protein [Spirochaetales bacterium]
MLLRSLTFYLLVLMTLAGILNSCSRDGTWLVKFNYQDREYSVRIKDVREDLLLTARRHRQITEDMDWHKNYLFSKYLSADVAVLEELDKGLMNTPDFKTAYDELSKQNVPHETIIKQIALEQCREELRKKFTETILSSITEKVLRDYYEKNKAAAVREKDGRMIQLTFPEVRDEIYEVVCEEHWHDFTKAWYEEMKLKYNVVYNEAGLHTLMNMEVNYIAEHAKALGPNIALHKPSTASSVLKNGSGSAMALDGREETEWSPATEKGPHWIAVDLGGKMPVGRVVLEWGEHYPSSFIVQASSDGNNWKDVFTVTEDTGGVNSVNEVLLENINERHIRIFIAGNTNFSLREFEVYN